jgi:predicted DNA repair protein MutK
MAQGGQRFGLNTSGSGGLHRDLDHADRRYLQPETFMSIGLIALLDDIAALAKVAAASVDDIAGQAAKAGAKAAGVVIDDAAVTPRYLVGFDAARELPIVRKIAVGSLRNKLLFLLPAALLLSLFAPWAITPLLMAGGAYLCFEGTEKVTEAVMPHEAPDAGAVRTLAIDPVTMEDDKVASAIKTDFILSAEIMAITLAAIPAGSLVTRALVLAMVGIAITVLVYGGVALIVKADDIGLALANNNRASWWGRGKAGFGRTLVLGMPHFLRLLGIVGTAAMIWVGGGIVVHGLAEYGLSQIEHLIAAAAALAASAVPAAAQATTWIVTAAGSGVVGLLLGVALIPLATGIVAPVWSWFRGQAGKARGA